MSALYCVSDNERIGIITNPQILPHGRSELFLPATPSPRSPVGRSDLAYSWIGNNWAISFDQSLSLSVLFLVIKRITGRHSLERRVIPILAVSKSWPTGVCLIKNKTHRWFGGSVKLRPTVLWSYLQSADHQDLPTGQLQWLPNGSSCSYISSHLTLVPLGWLSF